MSVDEVASALEGELEGLFPQLSADDEEDDYNYASLRYDYFPQLERPMIDASVEQIGGLTVDEDAAERESWWLAQLDAEAMVDDEEDDYSENLF